MIPRATRRCFLSPLTSFCLVSRALRSSSIEALGWFWALYIIGVSVSKTVKFVILFISRSISNGMVVSLTRLSLFCSSVSLWSVALGSVSTKLIVSTVLFSTIWKS